MLIRGADVVPGCSAGILLHTLHWGKIQLRSKSPSSQGRRAAHRSISIRRPRASSSWLDDGHAPWQRHLATRNEKDLSHLAMATLKCVGWSHSPVLGTASTFASWETYFQADRRMEAMSILPEHSLRLLVWQLGRQLRDAADLAHLLCYVCESLGRLLQWGRLFLCWSHC